MEPQYFMVYIGTIYKSPLKEDPVEDFACQVAEAMLLFPDKHKRFYTPEHIMYGLQKDIRKKHKIPVKQYRFLSDLLIARFRFEMFIIDIFAKETEPVDKSPGGCYH